MNKQHFLTRLGQWPKIQFTEVCITACGENGSLSSELYVRDGTEPPCWLFIRRLSASENHQSVLASYNLWLTEYHRQRGMGYLSLSSPESEAQRALIQQWQSVSRQPDTHESSAIGH